MATAGPVAWRRRQRQLRGRLLGGPLGRHRRRRGTLESAARRRGLRLRRTDGTWAQQAELLPTPRQSGTDEYGISVAISGDTIVVGGLADDKGLNQGSAYVFRRSGADWTQQARLLGPRSQGGFGYSVAISGDTLVGGSGISEHAVYVFDGASGAWVLRGRLGPSAEGGLGFGRSLALSGDTLVTGAWTLPPWNESTPVIGAYVFSVGRLTSLALNPPAAAIAPGGVPGLHRPRHRPRR